MKVLSDKTAARLLSHLDAAETEHPRHRPRRGAATTPPAPLWQIHLDGDDVRVDRGLYLADGAWRLTEPTVAGEFLARAYVVGRPDGASIAFSVEADPDEAGAPYHLFGRLFETGNSERYVEQYEGGPVAIDSHWGAVEPLVELAADGDGEWHAVKRSGGDAEPQAVAESSLVDIDVDADGKVTAKRYRTRTVDSRGNVVAISERTEDAAPDPGEAEEGGGGDDPFPPCGNPLNGGGDDNPLDDDLPDNPLDGEGGGGFSPACGSGN